MQFKTTRKLEKDECWNWKLTTDWWKGCRRDTNMRQLHYIKRRKICIELAWEIKDTSL